MITPTSGSAIARQLGDLALAAHRHLEHQRLGARARPRAPSAAARSRCSSSRGWRACAACGREQRREDVLGRGLAGRAGDRRPRGSRARAASAREAAERRERIVGRDHPRARRAAPRARARAPRARPTRPPRARAARTRRRRRARPAARRTGRPAPTARESTTARAGPGVVRVAGDERRARGRGQPAGVRSITRPPRARAQRLARDLTSSNGTLRPPSNSCPCSWPLPAITTTSPGCAPPTARSIAARGRSDLALGARAGAAPAISAMIALRVLRARVVGGHDHAVGEPPRRPRPSAGACRGRGRRRRRTRTCTPPPVGRARARRAARSRASRACGRSPPARELLALVDRLEAARHAVGARRAPRPRSSGVDAERARRGERGRARCRR